MRKSGLFQDIPLPEYWQEYVKWAVIETISLAFRAITYTRSLAINSAIERVRLAGQLDEARTEIAMLREEIRIKDARIAKVDARRSPRKSHSDSAPSVNTAASLWSNVSSAP